MWTVPGDIGRYQIYYTLVKQWFRNQVKDCKSYPGADINRNKIFTIQNINQYQMPHCKSFKK